jgi:hypothetical protein
MHIALLVFVAMLFLPAQILAQGWAWAQHHHVLVLMGVTWIVNAVFNAIFAHRTPEQVVASFQKNRWGALIVGLMRGFGLDPATLIHTIQRFLNAKAVNPIPEIVAQLPPSIQAVVRDPDLLRALNVHATKLLQTGPVPAPIAPTS